MEGESRKLHEERVPGVMLMSLKSKEAPDLLFPKHCKDVWQRDVLVSLN
jgi:hypothetical protein